MKTIGQSNPRQGYRTFLTLWFGQLVSLLGSQLTGFALGVWVYDQSHSVSLLALTQVAMQVPYALLSPLAGVLADRWNRRTAMIISDLGAGLSVLVVGVLYITHHLQVWMVIPINLCMASFQTLMWPSFTAATTLLVPKHQYGRASGFTQMGYALSSIAGPAIAGALYVSIRLGNMALIDFASYVFAIGLMLFFIRIPHLEPADHEVKEQRSFWKELRFGWDYIVHRKGLFTLLIFYMAFNFLTGVIGPLITPLILDTWDARTLGFLSTMMGVGMLAGTIVMSIWGGGKRKMYALLGAYLLDGLFLTAVCVRISIPLLAICGFGAMFTSPITGATNQAIWQAKVPPNLQGRVFGFSRSIAMSVSIIAPLLAAPLADYVFKPGMSAGGVLASILGPFIGIGPEHGIGVLISLVGIGIIAATLIALSIPALRRVELELPDQGSITETVSFQPSL